MFEREQHEMRLERTHPSNAEEWYCPTCGRRLLLRWPPYYEKTVLEPGNEYAIHCGGKSGVNLETMQAAQALEAAMPAETKAAEPEKTSLSPLWVNWLNEAGLGHLI